MKYIAQLSLLLFLIPVSVQAFDFNDVSARAKRLAAKPYSAPETDLPKALTNLTYDQYRDIRYKTNQGPWRDSKSAFDLAFFHPGNLFNVPVKIHEVVGANVHEIRFDPKMFDYGKNAIRPKELANAGLGFAGFRVHYPLNTAKYKDEVLVFLGASYFRALGKNQLYGLSARGLAIDTAISSGEEFPQFTEFWIQRPAQKDKQLVIYALLDSRRATGAYRFILKPGTDTVMDVKAQLFLRENVTKLGIAPLTSMYFFGENQRSQTEDYRPEVHDSDGLSVHSGTGEWIWRPLVNPKRLLVTSYALSNPAGFGLMQRDRQFGNYEDLEAHYERRPSAWVQPKGKWGSGRVELVQIPTPDETNDNIVAFWAPDTPPKPGAPFDIEYSLSWQKDSERRPPLSWVTQTRRGHGWRKAQDDSLALSVDFEGPVFKKLGTDDKVEAIVSTDANGKIEEINAIRNMMTGGWRMTVQLRKVDAKKPVELRGFLKHDNETISETWSYILPPE
ncbi:glucan biosynthesis protein G [Oxalobacteraceae bacterium R-40]|uniref:Glucans biosynthesis protein G n=1 Tax=Keguizhuia sedimenti TaxID=3064264 RepID=A0ABU1BTM6_9BURK|nr:glucan biosynthesis protein G [Oxalobacteraceae bacterium R-40]